MRIRNNRIAGYTEAYRPYELRYNTACSVGRCPTLMLAPFQGKKTVSSIVNRSCVT
ncbi:MAG: hypothetical protein LBJ00_08585 [Planctomycetaceae bacterium]|nr:hypothetical protein [Planctomycetaceae bacterium]